MKQKIKRCKTCLEKLTRFRYYHEELRCNVRTFDVAITSFGKYNSACEIDKEIKYKFYEAED